MSVCVCAFIYVCLSYTKDNLHPASNRLLHSFLFQPSKNLAPTVLRLYFETSAYFNVLKSHYNNVVKGSFFFCVCDYIKKVKY